MKIIKMRTNHLVNPVGYSMEQISLSWIAVDAKGERAVSARVEISLDPQFTQLVSDSGLREDLNSLSYVPELELAAGTRHYWRVQVWDDAGDSALSGTAFFETAAKL